MTFEKWMAKFDQALVERFGVPSECFPDWYFWDAWDSGQEVEEAVEEFLLDVKDY